MAVTHSTKQKPHSLEFSLMNLVILWRRWGSLARGSTLSRQLRSMTVMLQFMSSSCSQASPLLWSQLSRPSHFRQMRILTSPTISLSSRYLRVSSSSLASLQREQGLTTSSRLLPGKMRWLNLSMTCLGGRSRRWKRLQECGWWMGQTATARLLRSRKYAVWQTSSAADDTLLLSSTVLRERLFEAQTRSQSRLTLSEQSAGGSSSASFGGSITSVLCSSSLLKFLGVLPIFIARPMLPSQAPCSSLTPQLSPRCHDSQQSPSMWNSCIFWRTCLASLSISLASIFTRISSWWKLSLALSVNRSFILRFKAPFSSIMCLIYRERNWFVSSLRVNTPNRNDSLCLASSTPSKEGSMQTRLIELTKASCSSDSTKKALRLTGTSGGAAG